MAAATTGTRYYTANTVAALLEVAPCTVRQWCADGRLPGRKFGKLWKIPVALVNERLAQVEKGRGELLADARA